MRFYVETGSTDPCYNLAMEQYILEHKSEGDWLMLWQNDNTVVVGRNQNTMAEINVPFVEEHHITVVRRITGGGTVYHDLGNLNYSFITDAGEDALHSIQRFTQPVCEALRKMGAEAETSGRNDILIHGRKVSGVAQRLHHGRILHHGTLLFDSNPLMVEGALHVDPEKLRSKGAKSVRSRIGNIREEIPGEITMTQFWEVLRDELTKGTTQRPELTEEEFQEIRKLADDRYRNWEWTYGRSPEGNFMGKKRFPGGTMEIHAQIVKGRISDIRFMGDYMALEDSAPVTDALRNCMFQREEVRQCLKKLALDRYFGTITAEEILELLFEEKK